jgi:hypothetical protein
MTNWSFDHVAETRAALRAIVEHPAYGATALSNVRIMSEVLPGLLRGARLERSVLVTAASENLASSMLNHVSGGMDPGLAVRLSAHFLATISPVPLTACYRVAAELALALGLISPDEADVLASSEADPAADSGIGPAEDLVHRGPAQPTPPQTVSALRPPPPPDEANTTARGLGDIVPADGAGQKVGVTGDGLFAPGYDEGSHEAGVDPPAEPDGQSGAQPSPHPHYPAAPPPDVPLGQYAYGQPLGAPTMHAFGRTQGHEHAIQLAPLAGEWISHVVRDAVHPGLLAFNPPPEMHQGRSERIEVGIARSPELRDALTAGFRGRGLPEVVHVDASPLMGVELRGSSFAIQALSPVEQLVVPLARWEFDVRPLRSGSQTLTLCVTIRIDSPFVSGGQIAVPVFERDIRIKVDVVYGTRRFVASNWQWLVGTAVGLGGGIAAWISLVH